MDRLDVLQGGDVQAADKKLDVIAGARPAHPDFHGKELFGAGPGDGEMGRVLDDDRSGIRARNRPRRRTHGVVEPVPRQPLLSRDLPCGLQDLVAPVDL